MTYAESAPIGGGKRRRGRRRGADLMWFAARHRHGDPFGPFGGRGGRRASRGDIRAAILALLSERSMHGYQIIQELAERTGGAWRPSPGSVYPTLQQLEDEELVSEQKSDTGRRVYQLTDTGRAKAAELPTPAPWEQVAGAGTPAQVEAAQEVLRGARRSLYQILAEDDPADQAPTNDA